VAARIRKVVVGGTVTNAVFACKYSWGTKCQGTTLRRAENSAKERGFKPLRESFRRFRASFSQFPFGTAPHNLEHLASGTV